MNVEKKLLSINVKQNTEGWWFHPVRDRKQPLQKIIHPDVLLEFPATPLKSHPANGYRYGYELPLEAAQALTDEKAYKAWRKQRIPKELETLKRQLQFGSDNGENSHIHAQIRELQRELKRLSIPECPHCELVMRAVCLHTWFNEEVKIWECPKCRYFQDRNLQQVA